MCSRKGNLGSRNFVVPPYLLVFYNLILALLHKIVRYLGYEYSGYYHHDHHYKWVNKIQEK